MRAGLSLVAPGLLLILGSGSGVAQEPVASRMVLTAADYARAEKFLAPRTAPRGRLTNSVALSPEP